VRVYLTSLTSLSSERRVLALTKQERLLGDLEGLTRSALS
jgi:hypothetical protein